ncbi:translation machinery-associated protein 16 [Cryptotrichosporon argae]
MPGNKKHTLKTIKNKDSLHPSSRKAAQITRVHLRTAKLKHAAKDRKDLAIAKLFRPTFFLHALSSPHPLTLASLRALVTDVYLARNDERIAELSAERRPGRVKTKEHAELEELKRREEAEWETGFEVVDLTNPQMTRLLYSYVETSTPLSVGHVDLLRYIRISRSEPDAVVVSKPGRLEKMGLGAGVDGEGEDWTGGAGAPTDAGIEVDA